jgi:excisionase family DNA binding protein
VNTYLTPPEVAKRLRVSPERVIAWIRSGRLAAVNVGSGPKRPRYRVAQEAVDALLRSLAVAPHTPRPTRARRQRRPATWIEYV